MKRLILNSVLATWVAILLVGCDFQNIKDIEDGSRAFKNQPLDFVRLQAAILQPRCMTCHSPDTVDMTSYRAVLSRPGFVIPGEPERSRLYTVVQSRKMPLDGPLSKAEIELIFNWIASGAPERIQNDEGSATTSI